MTVINLKKKYIFIANMKTASTTIHYLLKKDNPDLISMKSVKTKPIGKHDNYNKIKFFLKTHNLNIDNFYIFGFIREPCDRMQSCFNHDITGNYLLRKYGLIYGYNIQSLTSYVNYGLEQHFQPFKYMFCNKNGILPTNVHIFKYEELDKSINNIFNKFNIPKPNKLPNINKSNIETNYIFDNKLKEVIKKRYPDDWSYYEVLLS